MASQYDLPYTGNQVETLLGKVSELEAAMPEKVSDLQNDAGYITEADIPTDVSDFNNDAGYITNAPVTAETQRAQQAEGALAGRLDAVEGKIPSAATTSNKLVTDADIANFITRSVNDLANYYLKSETYTKTDVNNLIGAINQFHYEIYASISVITSPASNVLYIIGPTGSGSDKYEEYVYSGGNFVMIGNTSIDLSGYVTTTALNTALANYTTTTALTTLLAGKVDKVNGKGLSTNDFTTEEQTKLSGIASGAQVNVIETVKVNGTALTPSSKAVNIDISDKADKDDDAVEGNIAAFDANGNPVDGGIPVGYISQLGQQINGIEERQVDFSQETEYGYMIQKSTKLWMSYKQSQCVMIEVEPSVPFSIVGTNKASAYGFLKSNTLVSGETADVSAVDDTIYDLAVKESVTGTIPSDCHYFYVLVYYNGNSTQPSSLVFGGVSGIDERLDTVEDEISEAFPKIAGPIYQKTAYDFNAYNPAIDEFFPVAKYMSGIAKLDLRNYSSNLYLTAYNSSNLQVWAVSTQALSDNVDGEIIPLIATTAGGSVVVGDIVAYIIFKDISSFTSTNDGAIRNPLNLDFVTREENSPRICSFMTMNEVRPYYLADGPAEAAIYENCISQLYLHPRSVQSVKYVSIACYSSILQVYAKNTTNGSAVWVSTINLSTYENNELVPMPVTTAGGGLPLGFIAGYIEFKDISTFKSTNYGAAKAWVDIDYITKLEKSRLLWGDLIVSKDSIGQMIKESLAGDIQICLPNIIYAAVGVEMNIYNDTIALSMDKGLISPTNYIVRWQCSKGTITNRGFRYTPQVADVGNVSLTCYVYNIVGELYGSKAITIKVVSGQLSTAKRVVFFGDSLGAGTATALYNDFNDGDLFSGTQPTMLGVRGTTPKYEAFGGARWTDFATAGRAAYRCQVSNVGPIALGSKYTNNGYTWEVVEVNEGNILITRNDVYSSTIAPQENGTLIPVGGGDNIAYTDATKEAANPLWYNDSIDFAHYRNTLGLGENEKLDLISFQLGANGDEDIATISQYIASLYNAAVADNANCVFVLGLTPGSCNMVDAYGDDYGAKDWMAMIKKLHARRRLYVELEESGDYPNMRLAAPNLNLDRYYGFPTGTRAVSARNNTQEEYHTNFIHPNSTGFAQLGDAFFSAYIAILNE